MEFAVGEIERYKKFESNTVSMIQRTRSKSLSNQVCTHH